MLPDGAKLFSQHCRQALQTGRMWRRWYRAWRTEAKLELVNDDASDLNGCGGVVVRTRGGWNIDTAAGFFATNIASLRLTDGKYNHYLPMHVSFERAAPRNQL